MNILSMQYFQAVVEEGSISAAARKLFISQQTMSEHIRKLEAEIGTPLFIRGKTLSLTLAGESFLMNSKEILRLNEVMMNDIQHITNDRLNRITVAIPTCFTPPYLGAIVSRFIDKHPQCEVRVVKRQHRDIAHNMNGVDLYMCFLSLSVALFISRVLVDVGLWVWFVG
ncbi:MAG: LysR family transcriptional regulator [Eubacteriales bacterium]|nr:LysR family transcriptional regulator [Eubacteriales bacterium]